MQAEPFLPRCSDVVIIGRVKWFPDSEHGSKVPGFDLPPIIAASRQSRHRLDLLNEIGQ